MALRGMQCLYFRDSDSVRLQDILEEALHGGLLEDAVSRNPSHVHSLLFDLLGNHLLPAQTSAHALSVPQYADHVARCIGLAVAAVTRQAQLPAASASSLVPFGTSASGSGGDAQAAGHAIDGVTLLGFLDSILSLPSGSAAT